MMAQGSSQDTPLTQRAAERAKRGSASDYLLDFGTPVTVILWTLMSRVASFSFTLYLIFRATGCKGTVRDHFISSQGSTSAYGRPHHHQRLGGVGGHIFQVWIVNGWGVRSWLKIKWSTPVKAPENNTLLIRDMGVTDSDMDDLEIYQQHLC